MLGGIFLQETPNLSQSGETWMEKELEETERRCAWTGWTVLSCF